MPPGSASLTSGLAQECFVARIEVFRTLTVRFKQMTCVDVRRELFIVQDQIGTDGADDISADAVKPSFLKLGPELGTLLFRMTEDMR